ncbi:MAG: DUF177 domain-containing protein [bacterium]
MKRRPWRVPIATLKQGSNRLEFELEPADIGAEKHEVAENPSFLKLVGLIKVGLDIVRSGRRFLVNGVVRFRARMVCAVCAGEFVRDYAEPLQTEFLGEGEVPPVDGKVMDGRDVERLRFEGDALELGPLVRDTIHLAIPIAPTCRPDCKGQCPTCGKDLNEGPCGCSPPADSPLAELKRLVGGEADDRP